PTEGSGPIPEAPTRTWQRVHDALRRGKFGLPGGTTLAKLLSKERGVRCPSDLAPLNAFGILAWADAHHARTGKWPTVLSGPIPEAPGEAWSAVEAALRHGCRGLPGGSTLARFIAQSGRTNRPSATSRPTPANTKSTRPGSVSWGARPAGISRLWPH